MATVFPPASDASVPLRSNGAPDVSGPMDLLVAAQLPGTTERPDSRRGVDPRDGAISPRDLAALSFIGRAGELAQYQLHAAVFGDVSEVVVSRFVRRAASRGLILVSRWRGIGINRLRLTTRGRALLIANGTDEQEIFTPRNPIAEGHIEHQLWIGDVMIVLARAARLPDLLQPAWALQRRAPERPAAIPDVLASFTEPASQPALLLGVEVDLGSERLKAVFLPKLEKLCTVMAEWAGDATPAIVLLTNNIRRRDALRAAAAGLPIAVVAEMLPPMPGRPGLAELQETFGFVR